VVGKSCSGLGVLWWFFERMGGLKNHYRWLTSVCSSFGYFFFFPVLMLKILADKMIDKHRIESHKQFLISSFLLLQHDFVIYQFKKKKGSEK